MDIPKEIMPRLDYDVPSDLLIFMRNDPMFYRKNFFPAIEEYKENTKDKTCLEKMVTKGLGEYVKKFEIPHDPKTIFGKGDMKKLVAEIIADEMEDQERGY